MPVVVLFQHQHVVRRGSLAAMLKVVGRSAVNNERGFGNDHILRITDSGEERKEGGDRPEFKWAMHGAFELGIA